MNVNSPNSLLNQGLQGMQNSYQQIQQSADQVVKAGTTEAGGPDNLATPLIEMQVQTRVYEASAQVVKSADEALGALLDIKA